MRSGRAMQNLAWQARLPAGARFCSLEVKKLARLGGE
jgi:hypothetical protein